MTLLQGQVVAPSAVDGGIDAAPPAAAQAAPAPAPAADGGAPAVVPPALTHFVSAAYPPDAEAAGITGAVTLSIVIDEKGAVGAVKVIDPGPSPRLRAGRGGGGQAVPILAGGDRREAGRRRDRIPLRVRHQARAAAPPADRKAGLAARQGHRARHAIDRWSPPALRRPTRPPRPTPRGVLRCGACRSGRSRSTSSRRRTTTLIVDEIIEAGKVKEVEYRMNRKRYGAFESVVRGARERKEVAVHEVSMKEINTVPGTQGDVLKVLQDLPGVARAPFGLGLLIVRGSAPQDTKVYLDGVEIPLIFHFGALTAVVNSDIISGLDFYPGNFAANYGNAMGGTVEIRTRDPKHEWHGAGHVDLYDGAAMVEGPVGNGSFLLSARRSWVDEVLKEVVPQRPHRRAGLLRLPGQVRAFALGADRPALSPTARRTSSTSSTQNTARVISFDTEVQFHRLAARWQRGFSGTTGATTPSSRSATPRRPTRSSTRSSSRGSSGPSACATRSTTARPTSSRWRWGPIRRCATSPTTSTCRPSRSRRARARSAWAASTPTPRRTPAPAPTGPQPALFATAAWVPLPRLRIQPGLRFDASSDIQSRQRLVVRPAHLALLHRRSRRR